MGGAWDVASVGFGIHNLVKNLQSGNVDAAIDDGVGIAVDLVSAFIPFVPGGVGAVRAGVKATDVVKSGAKTLDATKNVFKHRVKLRNRTKEIIKDNAPKNSAGQFIDPNTNLPIEPGQEVFGHKYGQEWKRYKNNPDNQKKSRGDVIEDQNNPYIYQIEDKQSNASHKYEKK